MPRYDVAVIGLGAAGSAALHELSRRGLRAIGIERHTPGHDLGSSHGETRMIRLGYFEHPSYVPLLRRAYELWRTLEASAKTKLLHITGIAEIGLPDSEVVEGTLAASRRHHLPHEVLGAAEFMQRFPAFRLPADFIAVLQPDGGFVVPEAAIAAMLAQATAAGADILSGAEVLSIAPSELGIHVRMAHREIEARSVVVAAGPWIQKFIPALPVRVTRQVMTWFTPRDPALFTLGRFPVFLLASRHGVHYGFPSTDARTIKVAKHHHLEQTTDPEGVDRSISVADEAAVRSAMTEHVPSASGPLVNAKTCLYTVTPDQHFVIDRLPDAPNVVIVSACSGHGFKFAPVIGEIAADLAIYGKTAHDINRFRLGRFG